MGTGQTKAGRRAAPQRAREAEGIDQVRIVVTPGFKAWLGELAEDCQLTMTDTITQALMKLAEGRGFRPPPRRAPKR